MSVPAPLRALGPELWVAERPQRFYGIEVGTRMSVMRLADGSLRTLAPSMSGATWWAAVTPTGGEVLGPDW